MKGPGKVLRKTRRKMGVQFSRYRSVLNTTIDDYLFDIDSQQPCQTYGLRYTDNGSAQVFRPNGDALDFGPAQVRASEFSPAEISIIEHYVCEHCSLEVCGPEIGLDHLARSELGSADLAIVHLCITKIAVLKQHILPPAFRRSYSD